MRRHGWRLSSFLCAGVAQLVEQLICNHQVAGSTPVAGSSFFDPPDFCGRSGASQGCDLSQVIRPVPGPHPSGSLRSFDFVPDKIVDSCRRLQLFRPPGLLRSFRGIARLRPVAGYLARPWASPFGLPSDARFLSRPACREGAWSAVFAAGGRRKAFIDCHRVKNTVEISIFRGNAVDMRGAFHNNTRLAFSRWGTQAVNGIRL